MLSKLATGAVCEIASPTIMPRIYINVACLKPVPNMRASSRWRGREMLRAGLDLSVPKRPGFYDKAHSYVLTAVRRDGFEPSPSSPSQRAILPDPARE